MFVRIEILYIAYWGDSLAALEGELRPVQSSIVVLKDLLEGRVLGLPVEFLDHVNSLGVADFPDLVQVAHQQFHVILEAGVVELLGQNSQVVRSEDERDVFNDLVVLWLT